MRFLPFFFAYFWFFSPRLAAREAFARN